jgi:cardiolipin synthase
MREFLSSHLVLVVELLVVYVIAFFVAIKILLENRSPAKTAAYLLLIFFVPLIGLLIYYYFGVNYRTKKKYRIKKYNDALFFNALKKQVLEKSQKLLLNRKDFLGAQTELVNLLVRDSLAGLSDNNKVKLLTNGEEKFPELFKAIERATQHIHIEYYIIEQGIIANQLKELLIKKSKEGVKVRMIYDDFGSKSIRKKYAEELRANGIEIYPFYKTRFVLFANRLNYRNHRKVVVIDGIVGFIGGINISDRYSNTLKTNEIYWRDTHLKIEGNAVQTLQLNFISDWNFCAENELDLSRNFFPEQHNEEHQIVQIASSGPDSERATLMFAFFSAIVSASQKVYITTPYLIPNESILTALKQAALSGLDVRLLLPAKSDSRLVNAASQSYFTELLEAGVRIFLYQKGFVHAKTLVLDNNLAVIGTANMDIRSFDLNFEINAFVYDEKVNSELNTAFLNDLNFSKEITLNSWSKRKKLRIVAESLMRLIAPIL